MPVVFVDRQIVGHESARALTLTHDAATGKEEVAAAHVARLRPHATRRDLSLLVGPAARGAPGGGGGGGGLPFIPTPPSTASSACVHRVAMERMPPLRHGDGLPLPAVARAQPGGGASTARNPTKKRARARKIGSQTERGPRPDGDRPEWLHDGRGQRRLEGARHYAAQFEDADAPILVRSQLTGLERNLMEWAVEPHGYSAELSAVQQMQAQFDPEKMRQAEVIASMTAKHRNMKPEAEDSTDGYYRAHGKWRPTPLIEAIRKRQWQQAAKLLAWSQVGRAQGHDALMEPRTANPHTHGRPLLKRGGSWSKEMSKRRDANPNYERPK